MTPEQKAAFVFAQAACAMAEVAGMQAANAARQYAGQLPQYRGEDFIDVTRRHGLSASAVVEFLSS